MTRKGRPDPVREGAKPPTPVAPRRAADQISGDRRQGDDGGDEVGRGKPTPARQMTKEEQASGTEPDADEVTLRVDGDEWVVRAMGRAGGASIGATPLVLLAFWRAGREDSESGPEREVVVVGRRLSDFTEDRLTEAFAGSRVPQPQDRPRGFFAEGRARVGRKQRRRS